MIRAYTLEELITALQNCIDWFECFMVNRAVMMDKEYYSQLTIDIFLRLVDKRVGQLSRQNKL